MTTTDSSTTPVSYEIAGRSVAMPVQVRDASNGTALFEVDAVAAADLLPGEAATAFEVVEVSPGRAHLALALVDYRDNDLGDYLEVGVMLFVRPRTGGPDGTFIVRLPVDQEFTCEAGCRIWGFPKTVEQIGWDLTEDSLTCTLTMDGELVLSLRLPRGGDDEMPAMEMASYTLIDGVPHTTAFTQQGSGSSVGFGEGVVLELGPHPLGRALAALGLPGPAAVSTWTERMTATFEAPRAL